MLYDLTVTTFTNYDDDEMPFIQSPNFKQSNLPLLKKVDRQFLCRETHFLDLTLCTFTFSPDDMLISTFLIAMTNTHFDFKKEKYFKLLYVYDCLTKELYFLKYNKQLAATFKYM